MLGVIDKSKTPKAPRVYLCKPDKTKIANLSEGFNAKVTYRYNDIHEFSIDIPYKVQRYNKVIHNKNVDKVRGRFLLNVDGEYYIIEKFDKASRSSKDIMSIECKHLPYELRDKDVRGLEGVYNLREALDLTILRDTYWTVDYLDPVFEQTYREFNVNGETQLQFLFGALKKFRAIIYWDSENRRMSFYQQDQFGLDRGMSISDMNYLKDIVDPTDMDTVCTRLRLYGKDGMSVHNVNPTGQNFIENFAYFMFPYEEDVNGNAINSSYWMSDDLCYAIVRYKEHVATKEGEFTTILDSLVIAYEEMSTLQTTLFNLETELEIIMDNLDLANMNEEPTGDLILQRNAKESEITDTENQITSKQTEIDGYEAQIETLRNELDVFNFYTSLFGGDEVKANALLEEKNNFEIYRTFENNSYFDSQELLEVGKEEIQKYILPPIDINISIQNFLHSVQSQRDWDRIGIGYIVYLTYENFGINVKTKITEMSIDYENHNINITLSDYQRLKDDEDYINDILYKTTSTSAQVEANRQWWERAQENNSFVSQLLQEGWDANALAIHSGTESEVTINRRGITIRAPEDPLNYLIARHGIIAITNDGGNTWKNALTKNGVIAERLTGQIIAGENLIITNQDVSLTIDQNGLTVNRSDNLARINLNASNGILIESRDSEFSPWESKLLIDEFGDLSMKGNIIMDGGTISWSTVNSDPDIEAIANGEYQGGTFISGQEIYSPTMKAGFFEGGSIKIGMFAFTTPE